MTGVSSNSAIERGCRFLAPLTYETPPGRLLTSNKCQRLEAPCLRRLKSWIERNPQSCQQAAARGFLEHLASHYATIIRQNCALAVELAICYAEDLIPASVKLTAMVKAAG